MADVRDERRRTQQDPQRRADFPVREPDVLSPLEGEDLREGREASLEEVRDLNSRAAQGPAEEQQGIRETEEGRSPEAGRAAAIQTDTGMKAPGSSRQPIGPQDVDRAMGIYEKYRQERTALTDRIRENQAYYEFTNTGKTRAKVAVHFNRTYSAYLFNSVANKHADFMDNFPAPAVLPREASDEDTARILSDVIPCILDRNDFEAEYSAECYDKIIGGTGVYGVFWDPKAEGGLGDIKVKACDIMNIFWQPGVEDIEDSPNLFVTSVEDNEKLKLMYPDLSDHFTGMAVYEARYDYEDQVDMTGKSLVIDWYYKKLVMMTDVTGQRKTDTVLHYCKFCNGQVLYSSENEGLIDGFYEHGHYPYVFDTMFPLKGSPAGFGYVDVMKNPQEYIDKLDGLTLENARVNANPRWWVPEGAGVNDQDFLDQKRKIVRYSGTIDGIQPIKAPDLPSITLETKNQKIEELKETSGNRDFSQGSTTSGVTAASAIAALQEAGSKLSRDMIKRTYNAHAKVCKLCIELIRQFYDIERIYRVTGQDKSYRYVAVSSQMLRTEDTDEFGELIAGHRIDFDVKVSAQRSSPFSRLSQNELAKELYSAGVFNPEFADQALMMLSMMDFEQHDEVVQKVSENAQLYRENQQLRQQVVQMAQALAGMSSDPRSAQTAAAIAQKYGMADTGAAVIPQSATMGEGVIEPGEAAGGDNARVENAREQARERSQVR